jgi:hypothetical protein
MEHKLIEQSVLIPGKSVEGFPLRNEYGIYVPPTILLMFVWLAVTHGQASYLFINYGQASSS